MIPDDLKTLAVLLVKQLEKAIVAGGGKKELSDAFRPRLALVGEDGYSVTVRPCQRGPTVTFTLRSSDDRARCDWNDQESALYDVPEEAFVEWAVGIFHRVRKFETRFEQAFRAISVAAEACSKAVQPVPRRDHDPRVHVNFGYGPPLGVYFKVEEDVVDCYHDDGVLSETYAGFDGYGDLGFRDWVRAGIEARLTAHSWLVRR